MWQRSKLHCITETRSNERLLLLLVFSVQPLVPFGIVVSKIVQFLNHVNNGQYRLCPRNIYTKYTYYPIKLHICHIILLDLLCRTGNTFSICNYIVIGMLPHTQSFIVEQFHGRQVIYLKLGSVGLQVTWFFLVRRTAVYIHYTI